MTTDNPAFAPIAGDVIASEIRRISGKRGTDNGLIEIPLYGHAFRYQVRIDRSAGTPRLTELRMVANDGGDIDPAAVRQVPVRRLAKAAAQFISMTEHGVTDVGDLFDPTGQARPDLEPGRRRRRNLGPEHYRQVAARLEYAREIGLPPREHVSDYYGVALPTLDRWIKQAKERGFLRRDWSTTTADNEETDQP